jgi:hypothetical protein
MSGKLTAGLSLNVAIVSRAQVARALDHPFVVLLVQDGADQANDGGLVGEVAHDLGPAFDLAHPRVKPEGRLLETAALMPS